MSDDPSKYSRKDLEKYYRWQAESLASFRAKFGSESNSQALDEIDRLQDLAKVQGAYRLQIENLKKILPILEQEFPLACSRRFRFYTVTDVIKAVLGDPTYSRHEVLGERIQEALAGRPWVDNTDYDPR